MGNKTEAHQSQRGNGTKIVVGSTSALKAGTAKPPAKKGGNHTVARS